MSTIAYNSAPAIGWLRDRQFDIAFLLGLPVLALISGAIVILDPNNGDILAMASWPTIDPNWFIPNISADAFKALQDDPQIPLLPRAYRSSYPPGSTFKIAVGIAALQEHVIETDSEFSCPSSMEIGHMTFRNWKKTGAGSLNFADALTQQLR